MSAQDYDDDLPTGAPMPGKRQTGRPVEESVDSRHNDTTEAVEPPKPRSDEPPQNGTPAEAPPPYRSASEPSPTRRERKRAKREQRTAKNPREDFRTVTSIVKSLSHNLAKRLGAASRRPGFYLTVLTYAALYVIVLVVTFTWLHGSAVFIPVVMLLAHFVYAMRKLLKHAYEPPNEAPPAALIPERGLPKVRYWVNRQYGRAHKVPRVNKKQDLEWRNNLRRERLRELIRLVQPTFMVTGWKGNSAKTFTAYIVGSVMALTLRGYNFIMMLASRNTKTGTAGSLAGLDGGKTIATRQLYSLLDEVKKTKGSRKLHSLAHPNAEGLRIIAEDPGGINQAVRDFINTMFVEMYDPVYDRSDVVVLDSGNDDVEEGTVVLAAMERTVVPVFSAFVGAPQTLPKLSATMEDYLSLARAEQKAGKQFPPKRKRETGEDVPLIEKVTHGIVVFSGLKKGETLEQYLQYVPEWFQGLVLSIRWDEYLSLVKENLETTKLDEYTLGDFLELAITVLEQSAWLLGIKLPSRHPAIDTAHVFPLADPAKAPDKPKVALADIPRRQVSATPNI